MNSYFFRINDKEVDKLMGSAEPSVGRNYTARKRFLHAVTGSVNSKCGVHQTTGEWKVDAPDHASIEKLFNLLVNFENNRYIFQVTTSNIQEILDWLHNHVEPEGYQIGNWFGGDISVMIADKDKALQFKLSTEGAKDGANFR